MNNGLALGLLKAGLVKKEDVERAEKLKELKRWAEIDRKVLIKAGAPKDSEEMILIDQIIDLLDHFPKDAELPRSHVDLRAVFRKPNRKSAVS